MTEDSPHPMWVLCARCGRYTCRCFVPTIKAYCGRRKYFEVLIVVVVLVACVIGLIAAVLHFERRTRPPGAEPWCLPCPESTT